MAHAATLDRLTDGLITSVTGRTARDASFRSLKLKAARGLRDQSHGRVNQFAVKGQLEGLIEKLTVLNRDDLADALEDRLAKLPTNSRWSPEVLALLLQLSNRPADKAIFPAEGLEDAVDPAAGLTWEEIIAEEPLDEADIWADIERGYHSSADELYDSEPDQYSEATGSTVATSVGNDDTTSIARLFLSQPDDDSLLAVTEDRRLAQARDYSAEYVAQPELAIVRDMLSAHRGLPCDLLSVQSSTGRVALSATARLGNTSDATTLDLLISSAQTASSINFLRVWTKSTQQIPHIRTIQGSTQQLLAIFDQELATIEQRFVSSQSRVVVSALDLHRQLKASAGALERLSSIVQIDSLSAHSDEQIGILDSLYDEVCLAQFANDIRAFRALATVLLAGLSTYLRPVAAWIQNGKLDATDRGSMFIKDSNPSCDPGKLWHDRYVLNTDEGVVPKCMQPLAKETFALGKSKAFLQQLNQTSRAWNELGIAAHTARKLPCFKALCEWFLDNSLLPFSQVLEDTIRAWVHDISLDCTPMLKDALWSEHGLSRMLDTLPLVFFSQDAPLFDALARDIDDRLSEEKTKFAWNDAFLLTELAQSTLSGVQQLDASSIQIRLLETEHESVTHSPASRLNSIQMQYVIPWMLQNVTSSATSETHGRVFAFLLQVHHARLVLDNSFFDLRAQNLRLSFISLRQKLIWLTGTLQAYITRTANVLHEEMKIAMQSAIDINSMVETWTKYEQRLQRSLLLSKSISPIRDTVTSMLELSDLLARTTQSQSILSLQDQFDKSLTFLINGVRGISRVGADSPLETLADTLGWGVP